MNHGHELRMTDQEMSDHGDPIADLITPGGLLCLADAWSNISKDQLVSAGVIGPGVGGSDWKRFNDDPMMFIMKLPPERLPALCKLLNEFHEEGQSRERSANA